MTDTDTIKRGPGRPPRAAEIQTERRRRQDDDQGRNMKLHVPENAKDPNFVYRWVNNKPGRIKQLTKMDDYDIVNVTDESIDVGSAGGSVVTRTVDSKEGDEAVLIRKPRQYYEADKAKADARLDAQDEHLRKGAAPSSEGLSGSEAYVPGGRRGQDGRNTISGR